MGNNASKQQSDVVNFYFHPGSGIICNIMHCSAMQCNKKMSQHCKARQVAATHGIKPGVKTFVLAISPLKTLLPLLSFLGKKGLLR